MYFSIVYIQFTKANIKQATLMMQTVLSATNSTSVVSAAAVYLENEMSIIADHFGSPGRAIGQTCPACGVCVSDNSI